MTNDSQQTDQLCDELTSNRFAPVVGANVWRLCSEMYNGNIARLARISGVSRSHLYNIKAGKADPKLSDIVKLADALGVAPTALLEPIKETPDEFKSGHVPFSLQVASAVRAGAAKRAGQTR